MKIKAGDNISVTIHWDRIVQHWQVDPDTALYHYTTPEAFYGIISSSSIWATQIQYLNDHRELHHTINLAERELNRRLAADDLPELKNFILERLQAVLRTQADSPIFVFSLSEEPDQLSQWRAYCRNGGYSVGFKTSALQKAGSEHGFELVKCVYDLQEQKTAVASLIDQTINEFLAAAPEHEDSRRLGFNIAAEFSPLLYELAAVFKDPAFQEEKE